ncbi:MAG: hypothetical protein AB7S81_06395 [Bdellovibrionales bacterium]
MTVSYLTAKVKEALEATDNNKRDAQKLLVTWAVRDQQLLLGLAKPHLKPLIDEKIDEALAKKKKDIKPSRKDVEDAVKEHATENEKRRYSKVCPPQADSCCRSIIDRLLGRK